MVSSRPSIEWQIAHLLAQLLCKFDRLDLHNAMVLFNPGPVT
jgi:hypothetical protein